jgi:hypothetical protein
VVGDELDRRSLGEDVQQRGGDRASGLAVADHAHLDRAATRQHVFAGPEGAAVEDARVVVGLARQADGLARAGDDQAVTVEVEPPAGGRASGQAPAAADEVDAVDRGQDRRDRDLGCDPVQVLAPLAMGGTGPAAVDPVSQAAMVNQVTLPRPAADLVADPLGILAPGMGVREADVLLWWGAEPLAAVGVPGGARPVGGDALTVHQEQVGHVPAGPGQRRALGRDRQPLGTSAQDGKRRPAGGVLVHVGSFQAECLLARQGDCAGRGHRPVAGASARRVPAFARATAWRMIRPCDPSEPAPARYLQLRGAQRIPPSWNPPRSSRRIAAGR